MNKIIDFHHTLEKIFQSIYCSEEMVRAPARAYSADGDAGPTIAGDPVAGYGFAGNCVGYGVASVSVFIYGGYFDKHVYVLYVFINKCTYIIYLS
jgi:hypothetical protein